MESVLIIGDAKSGTTALYSLIKNTLKNGLFVYEPSTESQFSFIKNNTDKNTVVKCLYERVGKDISHLQFFTKKVQIIRDPRDMLVSLLLYIPLLSGRYYDDDYIRGFTTLLEKKESKPSSVSILELFQYLKDSGYRGRINNRFSSLLENSKFYNDSLDNCLLFKYEDFIQNRLHDLEKHLGFPLNNNSNLSAHLTYNARQKKMGGWKSWFTSDDVVHFKPLLQGYIEYYGYDSSWDVETNQLLNPEHGSLYIRNSATRLKRLPNQFGHLKNKELYTSEYFSHLKSAATDGAEGAMLELALAVLAKYKEPQTIEESFYNQLDEAVQRNNPLALIYKGVALEFKIISSKNNPKPSALYSESAKQIGNPKCKKWIEKVRKEIKQIINI